MDKLDEIEDYICWNLSFNIDIDDILQDVFSIYNLNDEEEEYLKKIINNN